MLAALDLQASRFRPDSELSWLNAARGGLFLLGDGLAEAVSVALAAARWTGGLTDPTVGDALVSLGYDRDFAAIGEDPRWSPPREPRSPRRAGIWCGWTAIAPAPCRPASGWTWVPPPRAWARTGPCGPSCPPMGPAGGVLVSLGGDIAVAGTPPQDGWPVTVAEEPDPDCPPRGQLVRLPVGAVATSLVTVRHWRRGGVELHHIVDPRTGAARRRAVAHRDRGRGDLRGRQRSQHGGNRGGRPSRGIAGRDGSAGPADRYYGRVRDLNGWPAGAGAAVPVPGSSQVYAGGSR